MHIFIKNKFITFNNYKAKCAVGKRGIKLKKREGDLITPKGTFDITEIFYRKDRISGCFITATVENGLWIFSSLNF